MISIVFSIAFLALLNRANANRHVSECFVHSSLFTGHLMEQCVDVEIAGFKMDSDDVIHRGLQLALETLSRYFSGRTPLKPMDAPLVNCVDQRLNCVSTSDCQLYPVDMMKMSTKSKMKNSKLQVYQTINSVYLALANNPRILITRFDQVPQNLTDPFILGQAMVGKSSYSLGQARAPWLISINARSVEIGLFSVAHYAEAVIHELLHQIGYDHPVMGDRHKYMIYAFGECVRDFSEKMQISGSVDSTLLYDL